MKKFSKILMILCVLISQLGGSINVLAEEIIDANEEDKNEEVVIDENNEEEIKEEKNKEEKNKEENNQVVLYDDEEDINNDDIDATNYDFVISANGEEVADNYIISDNKDIYFKITLDDSIETGYDSISINGIDITANYDSENGYLISYIDSLYGEYSYSFVVTIGDKEITKDITVTNNSLNNSRDNARMLTDLNSADILFVSDKAYVLSGVSEDEIRNCLPGFDVSLVNPEEGNNSLLEVSKNGLSVSYELIYVEDENADEVIDFNDIISRVMADISDSILVDKEYNSGYDMNNDSSVDIMDTTKLYDYLINGWDHQFDIDKDNKLNTSIDSDILGEIKLGDTFTVRFTLDNFKEYNKIQGLSGKINFDNTILRLDDVTVYGDMEMYYNQDGEFVIFGNDYSDEDVMFECTFTSIAPTTGDSVSISDLKASYAGEEILLEENELNVDYVVTFENNKGGDTVDSKDEVVPTPLNNETTVTSRVKSSDSYLADLKISGVDFEFSPYTYKYEITVANDVNSLDLSVILSSNLATYSVYGNENFKVGENVVTVVVTAEDGSTHTYTLIVNKEKAKDSAKDKDEDTTEKKESSTSRIIIIILIILVIIGLIYLIFKDDEEDEEVNSNNNDNKKDNKNNKNKK